MTPQTDANICRVGDAVKATYKTNGDVYDATIASIDGDLVTVDWYDDDPDHRVIVRKFVFKDGVSCLERATGITRSSATTEGTVVM